MKKLCLFIFFYVFLSFNLIAESKQLIPVSSNGRIVPLDVYAKQFLTEIYGKSSIKKSDIKSFALHDKSALNFFLTLYFYGHEVFDHSPLFQVHHAALKSALNLKLTKNHFSYAELKEAIFEKENSNLKFMQLVIPYFYVKALNDFSPIAKSDKKELTNLTKGLFVTKQNENIIILKAPFSKPWHFLKPDMVLKENENDKKAVIDEALNLLTLLNQYETWHALTKNQTTYETYVSEMQLKGIPPKEIANLMESEIPIKRRLQENPLFKALPLKQSNVFVSIDALSLKMYDSKSNTIKLIDNFTNYNDASFYDLQKSYLSLKNAVLEKNEPLISSHVQQFADLLLKAYIQIEGTVAKEAFQKKNYYPTFNQLKIENFYFSYPFIPITILLYGVSLLLLILSKTLKRKKIANISYLFLISGFLLHTAILVSRSYILNRPPVSNMFETVIYVPWIAVIAGFVFYLKNKNNYFLIASSFVSLLLLILLEITGMNQKLENVQAVLDSNYWLTVHVLLIVGSYGIFFLSGILGQIYLSYSLFHAKETEEMKFLANFVLQTMYLGVFMLIPGTILGGVWAAESWGRFWDWDPKESWAFISACVYLIFVHAHRFKKIANFGLCAGSVIGLMAISFTWYGVNYILGTGLHSYGFGLGKDLYYYLFLLFQLAFLIVATYKHQKRLDIKNQNVL